MYKRVLYQRLSSASHLQDQGELRISIDLTLLVEPLQKNSEQFKYSGSKSVDTAAQAAS